MSFENDERVELLDFKNFVLPIGIGAVKGNIEDFIITIYDRGGNTFKFQVVGGNICNCNNFDSGEDIVYEVR